MNHTEDTDGWHSIDKHRMRFESPDIVMTRLIGDVSFDQNMQLLRWVDSLELPASGFYSVVDVAELGRQDPRLMKAAENLQPKHHCRAMVYFNARFHQRTLVNLFVRVARVFNHPLAKTPTQLFATEEEARAWIALDRKRKP